VPAILPSETIAHVKDGKPHGLEGHLCEVGKLAGEFAARFGNEDWAHLAGLWHDLGKYKADFQCYIRDRSGFEREEAEEGGPGKVDHTAAGAIHAMERVSAEFIRNMSEQAPSAPADKIEERAKELGRILGYLIAGHHSGLPDWIKEDASGRGLEERLQERRHLAESLEGGAPAGILDASIPITPPCGRRLDPEHCHLWIRMLFSCLVDADFLDTEAFMDPEKSSHRPGTADLMALRGKYDKSMAAMQACASDTLVNRLRQQILEDCRKGAELVPGLFSLTVPTGGGKTLASMGFALDHAIRHGKCRIVVVIPYTSIIEQTAKVLRDVFGDESVLEHHSNLDPDRETKASKLATENWDAPIVVTTNVQLFESLFAARTSACRKLHNLTDSVVILDEAQMLPPEFLKPILSGLRGLVVNFGVSVVLCTATQPALEGWIGSSAAPQGKGGFKGLSGVRELMRDPVELSHRLRRVHLTRHPNGDEACSWDEIAQELKLHDQVLCIVNTRKDCRELHRLLPEGTIHLSALMCGEHRSQVIAEIKAELKAGKPIRVVSTQLVEAGVDIDFPVVYRAMAGLDSIAQAAGRCNREGKLPDGKLGKVVAFLPPKPAPQGLLRKGEDTGKEMFRVAPEAVAELSPEAFQRYFKSFFGRINSFDEKGIMPLLAGPDVQRFQIQFRTAAQRFNLIDDAAQKAVVVWFKTDRYDSRKLLETLKIVGPKRDIMRRLQRCTVTVPENAWKILKENGSITEVHGPEGPLDLWEQCDGLYDKTFGLCLDNKDYDFVV
jgi:CRISPR-associated endonuclease/helicase Cas3